MVEKPLPQSKFTEKLQLSFYVLFYFLILYAVFILVMIIIFLVGMMSDNMALLDNQPVFLTFSYSIAAILSGGFVQQYVKERYLFRLEDYLGPRQKLQAYMFICLTLAISSTICFLIFKSNRDAFNTNSIRYEPYFIPPIIACIITTIAALWINKKPPVDPYTKTIDEKLHAEKNKWNIPFIAAVYILTSVVCIILLDINIFFSFLLPVLFTYLISTFLLPALNKEDKKFALRAKTVYPGNTPYQEMRHGKNYDSVMPTGDMPPATKETMYGKAAWMTDVDKNIYTAKTSDNKPSFEGLWLGGGFFHHKEGNLMSVAPPGSGKGAALIIPNLLWKRNYHHSFVVFDPKGTNACITARFRKEQGDRVIIIDPMGLQTLNRAKHGIAPSCFNPLDHIKQDVFNGCQQIANLLLPDDPGSKDKYWNTDARNLLQSILMHIMTHDAYAHRRNLITLHRTVIAADMPKLFTEMVENYLPFNGMIADTALGFLEMFKHSNTMFSSLRAVAGSSLQWISNPALQAILTKSDFNPSDLEKGKMTIYLCQPISNKEGFATFSRLVTGFCLRANSTPSDKPKAWVYYLLDEFPTMGNFPEVIEALAVAREYRMRLWLFAQSLSQLDNVYKQSTRHEILGNCTVIQAFAVTDHVTQEYISKRIGNQTVRYYKQSQSSNSSRSSSSVSASNETLGNGMSSSEDYRGKPLIGPDEIEQEPNIITLTKWGAMRLVKWQYWEEAYAPLSDYYRKIFRDGRADPNPNMMSSAGQTDKGNEQKKQEQQKKSTSGKTTKRGPNDSFVWEQHE